MLNSSSQNVWKNLDWWTVALYLILLVMGWFSICGACYDIETSTSLLDISTRTGMQLVWIGTSIVLATVILLLDDRLYETYAYLIYGILLLLLLATPFLAHDIKGSHSWIKIGSLSFQSAEFAKFATALALAKFMGRFDFRLRGSWKNTLISFSLLVLPMLLIILQHETGSALVYLSLLLMFYREGMHGSILIVGIAAVVYFIVGISYDETTIAGTANLGEFLVMLLIIGFLLLLIIIYLRPTKRSTKRSKDTFRTNYHLLLIYILLAVILTILSPYTFSWLPLVAIGLITVQLLVWAIKYRRKDYALIALFALGSLGFYYSSKGLLDHLAPHQQNRVLVLLGLKDDPNGVGYNVIQAKIAIGSGGLTGKGFLNGTQTKLHYVPEQETDFIFCTIGEEQGFVGSAVVLLCFLALLLRLLKLAERQSYGYGRIYGYCVFSIILFHLLVNIGMVLGLMPVIGIPLPFFSYGGSSLWGFTILLFIFLRIDASRNRSRH